MKKYLIYLTAAMLTPMFFGVASAQPNKGTGTATGVVKKELRLTWDHALNFGFFTSPSEVTVLSMGSQVGAVTNTNYSTITEYTQFVSGDANIHIFSTFPGSGSGQPGPATFNATGAPSLAITITLPPGTVPVNGNTVTMNNDGTTDPMYMDNFTSSVGSSATLDGTGNCYFAVGANLTVAANQSPGFYEGQFNVMVNYQ